MMCVRDKSKTVVRSDPQFHPVGGSQVVHAMGARGGMRRVAPLLLVCALIAPTAADDVEWVEFYDKASNKKAYYHSVTRESAWEAPEGAKIREMSPDGTASAQKTGKSDQRGTAFFILMLPITLVLGGLGLLFHMASKEGLMEALKAQAKKQRDRGQARA